MRRTYSINQDWQFSKNGTDFQNVNIPHTWNALDGNTGGNNYYRGRCIYKKNLDITPSKNELVYIEFKASAYTTEVYLNGKYVGKHEGGYSTFRFDITPFLTLDGNTLEVYVDNSVNDTVYPQTADFTFFGGIYRDVNLIIVNPVHFNLEYYGSIGIKATPILEHGKWLVDVEAYTNAEKDTEIEWQIYDEQGLVNHKTLLAQERTQLEIPNPILWEGLAHPYLYTIKAILKNKEESLDEVSTKVGLRTFLVDPNKGFFLNGKSYPLRGVSRHQDRIGKGYAISKADHEEDMKLILDIGANSIRLAHYQHDDYFYELCDQLGIIVWAEIPYITDPLPNGNCNAVLQFKELMMQCYHHASICCWGLSNEITLHGEKPEIFECHEKLLEIVKEDKTRLSTMAHILTLDPKSKLVGMTDICAYNHYFGWYLGDVSQYKEWFDNFHQTRPEVCIGLSEYGADAMIDYQAEHPEMGDYTESYQAYYHEKVLEQIAQMPYLWCSYVWNMFDFASDARNEAGHPGVNYKGLVSYDRTIKKDAFYVYKAYWSTKPFIHIAGKRYIKRHTDKTTIKVYTNQSEVSLYLDDKFIETKTGKYVFSFEIEISSNHTITAKTGSLQDTLHIEKVSEPHLPYISNGATVQNWFDKGTLSIKSKISEIVAVEGGKELLENLIKGIMSQNQSGMTSTPAAGIDPIKMMANFSLEKLLNKGGITDPNFIQKIDEEIRALNN